MYVSLPCFVVGTDITLVAHSRSVGLCLEAAEELQSTHSVSCEVSSSRTFPR
jgi:pyruvate/2-oxoglutarate/acetoin dehydrogenase E1 component